MLEGSSLLKGNQGATLSPVFFFRQPKEQQASLASFLLQPHKESNKKRVGIPETITATCFVNKSPNLPHPTYSKKKKEPSIVEGPTRTNAFNCSCFKQSFVAVCFLVYDTPTFTNASVVEQMEISSKSCCLFLLVSLETNRASTSTLYFVVFSLTSIGPRCRNKC